MFGTQKGKYEFYRKTFSLKNIYEKNLHSSTIKVISPPATLRDGKLHRQAFTIRKHPPYQHAKM